VTLAALRNELKANVEQPYKKGATNFFKEPIKPYGVRTPIVRKIARKYFPRHLPPSSILKLCDELWKSGWFEEGVVAIEWAHRAKVEDLAVFESWLHNYISNWAHVDGTCGQLIGPLLEQKPEWIPRIRTWITSKNRWVRRASAVAFVVPGRHGKYLDEIFSTAKKLMRDPDDLVQKGYGWMLKEAANAHQHKVFEFVMQHKKQMTRTALRYAIEKMPKAMKQRAMA
jgi:3-methyladenine DNA glycosylase AlkD